MVQNVGGLSPVEILALSSLKAGENRDAVLPGSHPVDFTVRIQGTVKVGEDTDKSPTARLPHIAVMALFIQRMGFQRDQATSILFECMQEAILMDKNSRETLLEAYPDIVECEEGLRAMMASLPPIRERGHVTVKLAVSAS